MRAERLSVINDGLQRLPATFVQQKFSTVNGEGLTTDEAEVWKRVLLFNLVKHLQPTTVLETHAGNGAATRLIKEASPGTKITALRNYKLVSKLSAHLFSLIDIDPFGQPYRALEMSLPLLAKGGVLCVTSGEIISVIRNLKNNYLATRHTGRHSWRFVLEDYIPYVEKMTGLTCRHFYAYPTSVRLTLSEKPLPDKIFHGCPRWMWWLNKYAQ